MDLAGGSRRRGAGDAPRRGRRSARSSASGRATRRCGPARTRPSGSAGSTSSTSSWRASITAAARRRGAAGGRSATCCSSAWAARASARTSSARRSGGSPGFPELLRAGLDRSGAGPGVREPRRPRADALRRVEKSGTTLEPNVFKEYFFERVRQAVGADKAGDRFVAITDPGSQLAELARAERFRHVLLGRASIGGRYSALSDFGLGPAAVMGLDVARLLAARPGDGARLRRRRPPPRRTPGPRSGRSWACSRCGPRQGHPGRLAGDPRSRGLARAAPGRVDGQGGDRPDPGRPGAARRAGGLRRRPRVRLPASRLRARCRPGPGGRRARARRARRSCGSRSPSRITSRRSSSAGSSRRPSPARSSGSTRSISPTSRPARWRRGGSRPSSRRPAPAGGDADPRGRRHPALRRPAERARARRPEAGRSSASCARTSAHSARRLRRAARLRRDDAGARGRAARRSARGSRRDRVATCLGFGPRFLHSTGQAYKGGPNSGVFLQITCDDARGPARARPAIHLRGREGGAGARRLQVLAERGRRALRVHLGPTSGGTGDARGRSSRPSADRPGPSSGRPPGRGLQKVGERRTLACRSA